MITDESLRPLFINDCKRFVKDESHSSKLWSEIVEAYTGKGRHYHTLEHLASMAEWMIRAHGEEALPDASVFALFYHDIVYRPLRNDNEEQSAKIARERLESFRVPEDIMALCEKMILATKGHLSAEDNSINIFLDADLAILGAPHEVYHRYSVNVRKEFSVVPELIYKPGRKKVLRHFLDMASIYKMPFFRDNLESQARHNIENEIRDLSR